MMDAFDPNDVPARKRGMMQALSVATQAWQYSSAAYTRVNSRARRKIATRMVAINKSSRADELDASKLSQCLVSVAKLGDRAAFEVLFRHFGPRIKSYLLQKGGDAAIAEEVMQETMVTIWRKAGQFDPSKAAASTWIFTIARNLRIDAYRRDRRPELDPDDPALTPENDPSAEQLVAQSQMEGHLKDVMAALSKDEQLLLTLSFYQDMSHSAISERLGLPLGTVKSRLRLSFGKLRAALRDRLGETV